MKISIRTKFVIFLALLLLSMVIILSSAVLHGIEMNQESEQETYLFKQSKVANNYIRELYHLKNEGQLRDFLKSDGTNIAKQLDAMLGMNVTLYDQAGNRIGQSLLFSDDVDLNAILPYAKKGNIAYQVSGEQLDYMSPLYDSKEQIGIIHFQYVIKRYQDFYKAVFRLFLGIGAAVFALSFIGGYFYFDHFVRRILGLKKAVESIEKGNFNVEILVDKNDEIGDLSRGIHHMNRQIKTNIEAMAEEQSHLTLAVQKLKEMEKQQKTFIGNVTHEFKTPLTVIKAYADLLDMYNDDPELLKQAGINIVKETERLSELVDQVLHLSSLEKYDFEVRLEKLNLKGIIEEVCDRMNGKAKKFGIKVSLNLSESVILGDYESMTRIFINLIDNGIKYNKPKGILQIISYYVDDDVYIEVINSGKPIPEEDREKVFEAFYTVDRNRSRAHGGTGLGLTIVKELVEKQGGTIKFVDKDLEHTALLIILPLA